MQARPIGSLKVSPLILGTWAIGGAMWGAYDEAAALKTIESAADLGITTIDTAPAYGNGQAEMLIGKVLANGKRESYQILTKCGIDTAHGFAMNLSKKFIKQEIENSLMRLRTDYIDLYQCHWPDPKTPLADTMEVLVKLKTQGKIREIGVCNFNEIQLREAFKLAPIASYQPQYSLLNRSVENRELAFCQDNLIAVIPYGVLGGGLLTGKYTIKPQFDPMDARAFFYPYYDDSHWPALEKAVARLRVIAQLKHTTPGNLAIAWAIAKGTMPLVGTRTPEQLAQNVLGTTMKLSSEEITELEKLFPQHHTHHKK